MNNKLHFIANKISENKQIKNDMDTAVRMRLNSYLGFDVDKLLDGTDGCVFGGAVRDCIRDWDPIEDEKNRINDVDILISGGEFYKEVCVALIMET